MTILIVVYLSAYFCFAQIRVPAGLDAYVPVPDSNPVSRAKVDLGKKLFFNKRLSIDGSVACATCHDPALAFTDRHKTAVGVSGRTGNRRTPRIANRAYGTSFFWDGRAASLEEQVLQPIANPKEMNLAPEEAAARAGVTVTVLRDALASYVRTILSGDSPYDRGEMSAQQREGLRLFRGKGGCTACHLGPNLTDEKLHDTGIEPGVRIKTPSLRDVAVAPPYMHDGSMTSLKDVVEFYDKGGRQTSNPELRPLHLSAAEKDALVAFLHSLTGTIRHGLED